MPIILSLVSVLATAALSASWQSKNLDLRSARLSPGSAIARTMGLLDLAKQGSSIMGRALTAAMAVTAASAVSTL